MEARPKNILTYLAMFSEEIGLYEKAYDKRSRSGLSVTCSLIALVCYKHLFNKSFFEDFFSFYKAFYNNINTVLVINKR